MITMLKTRDKALISLTALFQAALGIFGFLRMLVRKEIFCNENDFPALVWALVLLFVVTFAFAVIMRDLPSKTYVIPAFFNADDFFDRRFSRHRRRF